MFCPKCGKENKTAGQRCWFCFKKIIQIDSEQNKDKPASNIGQGFATKQSRRSPVLAYLIFGFIPFIIILVIAGKNSSQVSTISSGNSDANLPQNNPIQTSLGTRAQVLTANANAPTLSLSDQTRIKEIIVSVLQDVNEPTQETKLAFWKIIDPSGQTLSSDALNTIGYLYAGTAAYQRYFWQDASKSLAAGSVYKSAERLAYEQKLSQLGVMTSEREAANDALMIKIATRQPVTSNGSLAVFTQTMIANTLASIDAAMQRVKILFTPINQ